MASKITTSTIILFLILNLIFFTLTSACGSCTSSNPKPNPSHTSHTGSCPKDTLKLGVCADLLGGLLNLTVGTPPVTPCCSLIEGLADLEAAVCLCTAVKANILGINLDVPLSLSLLLNVCSKNVPSGYKCA